jgi:hypothetical protein
VIDLAHTQDRRLAQDLLFPGREHLSAEGDILHLYRALHLDPDPDLLQSAARGVGTLGRHHTLAPARDHPLDVEPPKFVAIAVPVHPQSAKLRRGTEAIPDHQHHLVGAGIVIPSHILPRQRGQMLDVDDPHLDHFLAPPLPDEADLRSGINVMLAAIHPRRKPHDRGHQLAVLQGQTMPLLERLSLLHPAVKQISAASILAVEDYWAPAAEEGQPLVTLFSRIAT